MASANGKGNGKLEEALTSLLQAQAIMVQTQAALASRQADADKNAAEFRTEMARLRKESEERFERIEAILLEHNRILRALPEAIRDKIGFKPRDESTP